MKFEEYCIFNHINLIFIFVVAWGSIRIPFLNLCKVFIECQFQRHNELYKLYKRHIIMKNTSNNVCIIKIIYCNTLWYYVIHTEFFWFSIANIDRGTVYRCPYSLHRNFIIDYEISSTTISLIDNSLENYTCFPVLWCYYHGYMSPQLSTKHLW